MNHVSCLLVWPVWPVFFSLGLAAGLEQDVPWKAQAEIARRGPLVERVGGVGDRQNATSAFMAAMQPPANDSHKWLFTLVTTRNCSWCEQFRRDFQTDPKLKAWVDTKDYTKSWAHFQVVQIEDPSQAWRWKDYRPTAFPTLIVQPPVNGSWGDPHTIVFAHQGYLKPADLDAAIRKAIQLYTVKIAPRRTLEEAKDRTVIAGGLQETRGAELSGTWTPPVAPPTPLPPVPSSPQYPTVPPAVSPADSTVASLLVQLLSSMFSGPAMANILLLAILAWQIYREVAKREGIPLLLDDNAAAQLQELIQALRRPGGAEPGAPASASGRAASNA